MEVVCTTCGCLAFKGVAFGNLAEKTRMTRWKKHWRSQGDFYRLGVRSKTDKVSYHSYELMYHRNLPTNLSKEDCFLEIGFGCHMSYGPGASAQIWPELYPEAHIHLLELEEPCVRRLGKEW